MHLIMTKEAGKLLPNSYRFLRFILKLAKAGLFKASLQQCVWSRLLVGSGTWGLWGQETCILSSGYLHSGSLDGNVDVCLNHCTWRRGGEGLKNLSFFFFVQPFPLCCSVQLCSTLWEGRCWHSTTCLCWSSAYKRHIMASRVPLNPKFVAKPLLKSIHFNLNQSVT